MKEYVRTILDYPVKGIQFRDITTLLQDAGHFKQVIDEMTEPWKNAAIDAVLSIESRGFIMAGAIAYNIGAAFVPLRKPDKLPGETYKVSYTLEYGSTEMHIHKDCGINIGFTIPQTGSAAEGRGSYLSSRELPL